MKYQLVLKPRAKRVMRSLPPVTRERMRITILNLQRDPYPDGCKKIQGYENHYRLKVGQPYRIVYEVTNVIRIIRVVAVGHRKDVYKRL